MQLTLWSNILDIFRLTSDKKVGGSTPILETKVVMKLACLVPQPLLSSDYNTEQV